ncbi:GDP-mannose 4,6-dehydratase [soil metagenome]
MVTALVTGAGGFVGRHLMDHLAEEGDDVTGCDRLDGFDVTDRTAVVERFALTRPEVVYHLAGWSDVGGSWAAPVEVFHVNAEGTLNVLLAATEAGVGRVVAVSSADVYGIVAEDELPIGEDAPLRPVSPYAASKVAADFLGLQAWLGARLEVIRVRAFNHLGPGQSPKFVAPALAQRVARNELSGADVVPVGNLAARRDMTDVRDVVRAYRLLSVKGDPGEVYNVCSGVDIAVEELAHRLIGQATTPMHLVADPDLQRPIDVPVLRGDNTKVCAATGWSPSITLDVTLADLLEEWRRKMRG